MKHCKIKNKLSVDLKTVDGFLTTVFIDKITHMEELENYNNCSKKITRIFFTDSDSSETCVDVSMRIKAINELIQYE